jgi:hypothetical protein
MSTELAPQESALSRDEASLACRDDLNFLAQVCLPELYEFPFPAIHRAVWQLLTTGSLQTHGKDRLALGIPRGFAKTILLKLYVVWLILFSDRRFILICCNTQALAENFLSDVYDILTSPNIIALFGDCRVFMEQDTLGQKKMTWRGRGIVLAAVGATSSVRGLNIKFVRPDIIICDDMQSREQAESPTVADQVLTWFLGTLLKLSSPKRCQYIFVGNMYPFDGSILKKLKHDPTWKSFITAAILEDGESIWPELKSKEALLEELESDTALGHPEIFFSEVMNDEEAGSRSGLDITLLQEVNEDSLPPFYESGCVIIDPSLGKKKSDDIVISAILIYEGIPVVAETLIDKWNPQEMNRAAIRLALKYGLPVVFIEGVAYQATASFWFNKELEFLGITEGLQAIPIYPKGSKTGRILQAFQDSMKGKIKFYADPKRRFSNQALMFNPAKTNNKDDILDVVAYIWPAIAEFQYVMQRPVMDLLADENSSASFSTELLLAF